MRMEFVCCSRVSVRCSAAVGGCPVGVSSTAEKIGCPYHRGQAAGATRLGRAISRGKPQELMVASPAMLKLLAVLLCVLVGMAAAELPSKRYLNLAAIKTIVAAAEAEAQKLHVE